MVVAPTIDKCINPCVAIVEKMSWMPIKRHDFVRVNKMRVVRM
jgi:hypothetical protein